MNSLKPVVDSALVKPLLRFGEFIGFRMGVLIGFAAGVVITLIIFSPYLRFN